VGTANQQVPPSTSAAVATAAAAATSTAVLTSGTNADPTALGADQHGTGPVAHPGTAATRAGTAAGDAALAGLSVTVIADTKASQGGGQTGNGSAPAASKDAVATAALPQPGPAAATSPATAPLATTPAASATPAWLQQAVHAQLTGRLVAAARGGDAGSVQRLTLHLHPADLGAVQVIATLDDGTVSLQLLAGNPATREALRSALGALRSDLVAAGLDGTRLDVSDQPPSQQGTAQQQFGSTSEGSPRGFTGTAPQAHPMDAQHRGADRPHAAVGERPAPPGPAQGVDLRL
jgi:flagellar hook-length control protein FliK